MQRVQLMRELQAMRLEVMRDEKLIFATIIGIVLTVDLVIAWVLFAR